MRIVIADDEPLALDLLRLFLQDTPDVELVGEAQDGAELLTLSRRHEVDLIISDIGMPLMDGLQAVRDLVKSPRPTGLPKIIFTTANPRHAVSAFDLGVTDYLVKPMDRERLARALGRARAQLTAERALAARSNEGLLWLPSASGRIRIALSEITRVEAADDHVYLHTSQKIHLHRITMKALERLLSGTELVRIHRSHFIRLSDVRQVDSSGKSVTLTLDDGSSVSLGSGYRHVLEDLKVGGRLST